jgi:uracil phosphoribosyltransferase
MVYNLSDQQSLITQWVSEIRDIEIQNDRARFRRNMERIAEVAAYEISKQLPFVTKKVITPLGESEIRVMAEQPVLATILRAGIPMHNGLAYRKHHRDGTFEIEQHYITCPSLKDRPLIIADPMLATGASLILALETLLNYGTPTQIHIVSAIACLEGIENVERKFPDVSIWTAAVDEELTARGYIVPGLGDAGDLAFGSKEQF